MHLGIYQYPELPTVSFEEAVEKWRVGTIATQLGIHHSSVEHIISQAGMPKVERARGASMEQIGVRSCICHIKIIALEFDMF